MNYALVPILIVALALWWHRDDPAARAWSLIGICLLSLPGQVFFVSEAIIAVQLWWPLLVLVAAGRWRKHVWSAGILALIVVGLHPASALLLGAISAVLVLRRGAGRVEVVVASGIGVAGAARYSMVSVHEGERIPRTVGALLYGGQILTAAYLLILGTVLLAALRTVRPSWDTTVARAATWISAGGALFALVVAALRSTTLAGAMQTRLVIPIAAVVLGAVAAVHLSGRQRDSARALTQVAVAGVAVSVLFVSAAGITWAVLVRQELQPFVAAGATCRYLDDLQSVQGTPLDHWATAALTILMQGRSPRALVLSYDGACDLAREGGPIVLEAVPEAGTRDRWGIGWFDLRTAGIR